MQESEKMTWSAEIAPFTQNSPITIVKVVGVNNAGRKCERVIFVSSPITGEAPTPVFNTEWVKEEA